MEHLYGVLPKSVIFGLSLCALSIDTARRFQTNSGPCRCTPYQPHGPTAGFTGQYQPTHRKRPYFLVNFNSFSCHWVTLLCCFNDLNTDPKMVLKHWPKFK